jgi:D-alanyl-D-alanine carboxypeptidase
MPAVLLAGLLLAGKTDPIDTWAQTRMTRDHIPGMAVAIYRNGKRIKAKAYGSIDLERNVKARLDSPFEICSITKQFTAAAVLFLAEDGKLSLDDPLAKWFPTAPAAWKDMTIADALHHLTGLSDPLLEGLIVGAPLDEAIAEYAKEAPLSPPRTRWAYNNSAYTLLKPIVEKASGQPFWTFLKQRIFDPIGMRHTMPNDGGVLPGRVRGYVWKESRYVNSNPLWESVGTSAGGLLSTVDDLALWSEALRTGKLLKPASRTAMLTPGRLASGEPAWNEISDGYGLGVFLRTVDGRTIEKHSGGWSSASAQLTRIPEDGLTIVVLTNRGGLGERPWWGEELGEIVTRRKLLPSFEIAPDPDAARTARVRAMVEKENWKLGKLKNFGFIRAIPQGETTALEFRAEFDVPVVVTVWQRGQVLEDLEHFEVPKTH